MSLPQLGSLIASKYRLEAPLGEGGMGAVYRARHEVMGKPVALKWLKPGVSDEARAEERFIQEARAAARIRHPNVVDVYDVGRHEGGLYMVMELLEGQSFADMLDAAEAPLSSALRHLVAAMHGVAAAHAAGIIHRDIKPENIFVEYDGHHADGIAKILDFGISKLHDDARIAHTRPGTTMGTPHYMSFEQMNGASDIDRRTDIYAFGVLLYRTLTGVQPFDGTSFASILIKCAGERPASPKKLRPELPAALDRVVMKAIALRREDRFGSLSELIEALTQSSALDATQRWATAPIPVGTSVHRTDAQREPFERTLAAATRAPASASGLRSTPPGAMSSRTRLLGPRVALLVGAAALVGLAGAAYALLRDHPSGPAATSRELPPRAAPAFPAAAAPPKQEEPVLPATPSTLRPDAQRPGTATAGAGAEAPRASTTLPRRADSEAATANTRDSFGAQSRAASLPSGAPRLRSATSEAAKSTRPLEPLRARPVTTDDGRESRSAATAEPSQHEATGAPTTQAAPASGQPNPARANEADHRSGTLRREDL